MAGSAIAITSRRRPVPTGDEEATTTLKLGEMRHATAISTAAAHQILVSIEEDRIKRGENPLVKNDLTNKTTQYLETFARFKGTETVTAVSAEVEQLGMLAEFEKAQLGTLCCDTAEEARTLVPSLEGKISDDDLQAVLDNISKLRDFS